MTKKPIYCKCGHLSHPTHDTHKSFLGMKFNARRGCNGKIKINETTTIKCDCHRFLLETYPTKFDSGIAYGVIGSLVVIMIMLGLGAYGISQLLDCKDPACLKTLSTKVFTVKEAFTLFFIGALLGIVYMFGVFYDMLYQHQYWKKREKREHQE